MGNLPPPTASKRLSHILHRFLTVIARPRHVPQWQAGGTAARIKISTTPLYLQFGAGLVHTINAVTASCCRVSKVFEGIGGDGVEFARGTCAADGGEGGEGGANGSWV